MSDDVFDVDDDGSVVLRLHVQPGAGRTALTGRHGDAVKVKVAVPPERGQANDACVQLVAFTLGVPKGQVELVSGPASRSKRVRITGVEPDEVRRLLAAAVAGPGDAGREPRSPGNARPGRGVR
ncbi:MAG TPA: DUF167 domain-containing protein [Acidimicrobiales bacterium]|nr:DUF167 domain-containing protein [Acidimicrobiales bacterium]